MAQSMLPHYHSPCGWTALLPSRTPQPSAAGRVRAKYAVVGAGYTGLAAARRLAELAPSESVIVLEGGQIDEGSSARNSGFMTPRDSKIGLSVKDLPRAEQVNAFSQEGFDYLMAIMEQAGFSIDLHLSGRITAAATDQGRAKIEAMRSGAETHGFAHRYLSREALSTMIGTSYYQCGLKIDDGFLMQPAKLVRGLAASLPAQVKLYEQSPVLELAPAARGMGWRLRTPQAEIEAEQVVLATNAAIKAFGFWRDRLVTIYTFAGMTGPMRPEEISTLGVPVWGVLPAHRLGTTVRRVDDSRLMVRSLYAYEAPLPADQVEKALTSCFHRRYPHLSHVPLPLVWGGTTALTMNGAPMWGQISKGLYASAGCNGSGVVKGTVLGKRLAESIVTGDPQEALQAAYGRASWVAPEPFRRIGFYAVSAYESRKAALEH